MSKTVKDFLDLYEPLIFDKTHVCKGLGKSFIEYEASLQQVLYKTMFHVETILQRSISKDIDQICVDNYKFFKEFIFSENRYKNIELCKNIYMMEKDDLQRLISHTAAYCNDEPTSYYTNLEGDEFFKDIISRVNELKQYIDYHYDEYFNKEDFAYPILHLIVQSNDPELMNEDNELMGKHLDSDIEQSN